MPNELENARAVSDHGVYKSLKEDFGLSLSMNAIKVSGYNNFSFFFVPSFSLSEI